MGDWSVVESPTPTSDWTVVDPDAQPEVGAATTLGLNATNLFGAGAAIGGAVNSIARGGKYEEWRDKFRAALNAGNEQHPGAKWLGRGISLAAETVVGGAAGKAAGAAGKALGFAPKFTSPVTEAAAKGFASGAGYGAAGGAGEALSKDEDVATGAIKGASIGSLLGGAIGGAAGKVAQKIKGLRGAPPEAYSAIDDALGGGVTASVPVELIRNKAATEVGDAARKALETEADRLERLYSTVSTDEAKKVLLNRVPHGDQSARDELGKLAESLPLGKQWTKESFLDHLAGGNSKEAWHSIDPTLRREVEQMPWRFDPQFKVPISVLRRDSREAADEHARKVVDFVLNRELDRAVQINPAAKVAAEQIAQGEAKISKALGHKVTESGSKLLSGYELLSAGHKAFAGDPIGAAKHLLGAALAHKAPEIIKLAKTLSNEALAGLERSAAQGDRRSAELFAAIKAVKSATINVAANAPVGAVTQSTLGGEQQ